MKGNTALATALLIAAMIATTPAWASTETPGFFGTLNANPWFISQFDMSDGSCADTPCLFMNEGFVDARYVNVDGDLDLIGNYLIMGNLTVDSVFKVDDTSNRVGINVANPTVALDVSGEMKLSGVSSDGAGRAVCIKSDNSLGTAPVTLGLVGNCT